MWEGVRSASGCLWGKMASINCSGAGIYVEWYNVYVYLQDRPKPL